MVVVNLSDVYAEIETRLKTIPKLNIPPIEAETITPDAAVWALPQQRDYLASYGGGLEQHEIELTVCVSKNAMRSAVQRALEYTDPTGPRSIPAAINSSPAKPYASCDEVTVLKSEFDTVRYGDQDYLGCVFTINIAGSGGAER